MKQLTTEEEFKKNSELNWGDVNAISGWIKDQKHLPKISGRFELL